MLLTMLLARLPLTWILSALFCKILKDLLDLRSQLLPIHGQLLVELFGQAADEDTEVCSPS